MFHNFLLVIIALLLPANIVTGHMTPLSEEQLAQPIQLSCGVTITEWRGESVPNQSDINKLDALCSKALKAFKPFLTRKGLAAPRDGDFAWSFALVPDGTCYRCMNDVKYRFKYRSDTQMLWGYTGRDQKYAFTISNVSMSYYKTIFVHELFHSMSMYYGLFDSHSNNDSEKAAKDERLAKQFTKSLGLGE